jgi:iron complex transport system substrate-binding protein
MAGKKSREMLRIVSLAPNVTSILFALGASRELVGVSKWCKEVAPVGLRPQVGDCWKMDVREVMRLEPTLLIGSVPFAPETVASILKEPVAFLAINPRTLADIETDIRTLARLVNRASAGEKLIREMGSHFKSLARQVQQFRKRTRPCPRVYCEAWPHPRFSSPPWVSELVEMVGGEAVVPAGTRVTDEEVERARPDVIVLAWTAAGDRSKPSSALRNAAWQDVPAIKAGRVVVIRDDLLNTPGPPLVEGARALFRAIHPDAGLRGRTTGATGAAMITVVAALIQAEGKLLVCQRKRGTSFAMMWEFPGGKVKPGETLEQALVRELEEELGTQATIGSEVYRAQHRYAELSDAIELIFFKAHLDPKKVRNLVFEEILWREPRSLPELNFLPADKELIEKLASGGLLCEGRK